MRPRRLLILLFLQAVSLPLSAQFTDSLRINVGATGTVAANPYQPLWLVANRLGTLTDQKADVSTYVQFGNTHRLGRPYTADTAGAPAGTDKGLYLNYGMALYNHDHFRNFFIAQGYATLNYRNWQVGGGRYAEISGEADRELSSGALGVSGNALPVPKVSIAVTDYSRVPFSKGWLQFKGRYSHGWLGGAQYVKNAFLHEKSFYLRVGKGRFHLYGGLNHFAQWGGVHPQGPTPHRFKDYLRIVAGAQGNGADPVFQQGPVDIANAVGNHLIIPDFGVAYKSGSSKFTLYTQNIFEKGKGRGAYERDRLVALKIFGRDRLVGFNWEDEQGRLFRKIVVEAIYTRHQGGPVVFEGRDNYYNNSVYNSGWQYQGRIIGTPLFINRSRGAHYNLAPTHAGDWEIVSNRVAGGHIGVKGQLSRLVGYRSLVTYVQHSGNYYNDAAFSPAKNQWHLLQEVNLRLKNGLLIIGALGIDAGDLSRNAGGLLRIEKTVF